MVKSLLTLINLPAEITGAVRLSPLELQSGIKK